MTRHWQEGAVGLFWVGELQHYLRAPTASEAETALHSPVHPAPRCAGSSQAPAGPGAQSGLPSGRGRPIEERKQGKSTRRRTAHTGSVPGGD